MNGKERILAQVQGGSPDHLPIMPITMMFAADQIGADYRSYAQDCEVLAEAQIQTAEKFGFDYISVISDPCREGADLGAEVEWFDNQPPAFREGAALLADRNVLDTLEVPDPAVSPRMSDRVKGVSLLQKRSGSTRLVEGWVEGPCAQSANLRGINTLMLDFFDSPDFVRILFDFVVELELQFARAQIEAGADLIGIGDAASSLVGPALYEEFVFPCQRRLVSEIKKMGALTRLHICGKTRKVLPWMTTSGADIIDLDWMVPMAEARLCAGPQQVLLGNIDPVQVLRNSRPEEIRRALEDCHRQAGNRYIVGAGCEVVRDTPDVNVEALVSFGVMSGVSDR